MIDGTDIGMSRADTGTGLEAKKPLCSGDVWQAQAPAAARTLPAMIDPVWELSSMLLHSAGLQPATSPLNLTYFKKKSQLPPSVVFIFT